MQRRDRTLFDAIPSWAASAKRIIELPLDAYLRRKNLRVKVTYDTAAAADVAEDGVLNAISRINLRVNGKTKRSWSPNREWYRHPLDLPAKPEYVEVTTTEADDKVAVFNLPIDFALDRDDDEDVAALLPLLHLSSAKLEIEFGAATALGTNQTITDVEVTPTLFEYVLSEADELALYGAVGTKVAKQGSRLLEVIEQQDDHTIDAAYSDFGFNFDLPTGHALLRTHLFAIDNGVRDDDILDNYRIRQVSPHRVDYLEETWEQSQARDKIEYGVSDGDIIEGNVYLTGYTIVDYVDYGILDLREKRVGSVKFQASTGSPTGTSKLTVIHEMVAPVSY